MQTNHRVSRIIKSVMEGTYLTSNRSTVKSILERELTKEIPSLYYNRVISSDKIPKNVDIVILTKLGKPFVGKVKLNSYDIEIFTINSSCEELNLIDIIYWAPLPDLPREFLGKV